MLIREMSRKECEDLLSRLGFGRLACARDNTPYVVPIYFACETDRIFAFSTMGQKIEWMRLNPAVCVEADEVLSPTDWTSVVARGHYEEFPDTPEYSEARKQAQEHLQKARPLWWQPGFAATQTRGRFDRDVTVFYCVHIEEISGRRASPDPAA